MQVRKVVPEVHDSIDVLDLAVGRGSVGGGAAIPGNQEFLRMPVLVDQPGGPVECLGADGHPRTEHVREGCRWRYVDIADLIVRRPRTGGGIDIDAYVTEG
jgi:hypothetical protein